MQKIACHNEPQNNPQYTTVSDLLGALTPDQHQQLHNFAARRLERVAAWPAMSRLLAGKTPDDLIHHALTKFLLGETHPKKGRQLSSKGRQSTESFVHCVFSAINSDLHNLSASAEAVGQHLLASDEENVVGTVNLAEPLDPMRLLERRDLRRVMFERLDEVANQEPALTPVIQHWSEHFEGADRIAGPEFEHNLVDRVRQHARQILRELAREIQPHSPTGMEILM